MKPVLWLILFTVAWPGHAADFCTDPHAAICEAPGMSRADRNARVDRLNEEVKLRAAEELVKAYASADPANLVLLSKEMLFYNQRVSALVAERVTRVETEAVLANIETVKGYLKAAILDEFMQGRLTDATRDAMTKVVDRTIVYTEFMLKAKNPGAHKFLNLGLLSYHLTCGFDGLSNNAYASLEGDVPYIVLCPGWLMRAQGTGSDTNENFLNIVQVMAHELGHHIDYSAHPQAFYKFARCLAHEHGDLLAYGEGWFDKLVQGFPPAAAPFARRYKVLRHAREITADFWAAQTVRQYLIAQAPENRLKALQSAWSGLCGTEDEGVHPNGRYRMEVLLRSDPQIHALLGCALPASERVPLPRKGCNLSGATADPIF